MHVFLCKVKTTIKNRSLLCVIKKILYIYNVTAKALKFSYRNKLNATLEYLHNFRVADLYNEGVIQIFTKERVN